MEEIKKKTEEEIKKVEDEKKDPQVEELLKALDDKNKNSVPRDKFEKLEKNYKAVFDAYMKGQKPSKKEEEKPVDVNELKKKLFAGPPISNREFVESALKLRQEEIDAGHPDPFLPHGSSKKPYKPTLEEEDTAQRVAETLQSIVDYAKGDDQRFNAELDVNLGEPDIVIPTQRNRSSRRRR